MQATRLCQPTLAVPRLQPRQLRPPASGSAALAALAYGPRLLKPLSRRLPREVRGGVSSLPLPPPSGLGPGTLVHCVFTVGGTPVLYAGAVRNSEQRKRRRRRRRSQARCVGGCAAEPEEGGQRVPPLRMAQLLGAAGAEHRGGGSAPLFPGIHLSGAACCSACYACWLQMHGQLHKASDRLALS